MPEINLNSSKPTAWSGRFYYEVNQNISSNYSDIDIMVYAQKNDGYSSGTNSGKWTASITVGGTTKTLSSIGGFALPPSGCWIGSNYKGGDRQAALDHAESKGYVCVASFRVYHENDGSINCGISITVCPPSDTSSSSGMYGQTLTYDSSFSSDDGRIPKIPRASTIDSAKDVYFGESCQITWTPPSASFYYKLKFSLGSQSEEIGPFCPGVSESYSYSDYVIPNKFAEEIPNSISATMSVSLSSYDSASCDNQIGTTSTATFTVTVPENDTFIPSISGSAISIDNDSNETIDGWNVALAGFSRLNIVAHASGVYGSTISSFTVDSTTVATMSNSKETTLEYSTGIITFSGNKKYVITCMDSRGRTSKQCVTEELTVLPYSTPKVTKFTVSKNTNNTDDLSDDRMTVTGGWEYDKVNNGIEDLNSVRAVVYYKLSTATDWTLHPGFLENNIPFTVSELSLDDTKSYNFKIVVTDSVGSSVQKEAFSSTTTVLMDFQAGGKGLGIGKICEVDNTGNNNGSLEVSMSSYFWGNIKLMGSSILILGSDMFGEERPEDKISSPVPGQFYFKKVVN